MGFFSFIFCVNFLLTKRCYMWYNGEFGRATNQRGPPGLVKYNFN